MHSSLEEWYASSPLSLTARPPNQRLRKDLKFPVYASTYLMFKKRLFKRVNTTPLYENTLSVRDHDLLEYRPVRRCIDWKNDPVWTDNDYSILILVRKDSQTGDRLMNTGKIVILFRNHLNAMGKERVFYVSPDEVYISTWTKMSEYIDKNNVKRKPPLTPSHFDPSSEL